MIRPYIATRPLFAAATGLLFAAATIVCTAALAAPAAAARPAPEIRGNLVLDGVPPHSPRVLATLDGWLAGRGANFQDFLPDGSVLITTRFGDTEQVHHVARPGGAREQLTFDVEPAGAASANPARGAKSFLFSRDRGGNENTQLYLQNLDTREVRRLTDGKSRHGGAVWSRDGRRLAFQGNARNGVNQDVYVIEPDGNAGPRLVVAAQGHTWTPLDWSPDGQRLLLLDYRSVTDASLYVADVATGALRPVSLAGAADKPQPQTGIGNARFAADGRGVWLTADLGGEFRQLRYADLADGSLRTLTAELPWDIDDFEASADGRWLAYVANVDGYSELRIADLGAAVTLQPRGLPAGLISGLRFDRNGNSLGMSIETSISPRDVWTYDIGKAEATRWTRSETGPIDPARLSAAQVFRYPTWDRVNGAPRLVPALIQKPAVTGGTDNGRRPVVIDIHGGPEGQSRPDYSPFLQYLVAELGYAVIQPNVRGSTGYGRNYTMLDNGRLREDSVRDIGALLVWIAAQPDLDANRVVVMGGSYGGYMVLASLIAYGDRLRGGIDVVGISNFVTFLTATAGYRRDLRRVEYGDERDPSMRDFLQRISPLGKAGMIRRPLLVVQGLNDPRVPAAESEQMVAGVRAQGGEVWYLAARDEGHGFRKKVNRDFYLKTAATFLERMAATP
jgi:dipeptidyl aminopeptidase/acylaminoacyl peptidase